MDSENKKVPRELSGFRKVGYASGAMAQMGGFGLYNAFTFQYYVYTVRLDPFITSVGLFIGLFVYAVTAPVMGVFADNRVPDKYGKRKKFLLIGAPVQMILLFLLWTPPIPPNIWTAIYMWSISGLLNLTQATIVSAYLSMLTDQCQTEKNRVETASLQGLFSIIGTFISVLLPIILQSLVEDPQNPAWNTSSGALLMRAMPIIGGIYGVSTFVIFLIVYNVTDESFYSKECTGPKKTISESFKKIFEPFQDPRYRYWIYNSFVFNMAMRFLIVLVLPILIYVLLLQQTQFLVFMAVLTPFGFGGFLLWRSIIKRSGLKRAYSTSLLLNALGTVLALVFLVEMNDLTRLLMGLAVMGINIASLVGGYVFPNPIISSLVDLRTHELLLKNNQEKGIDVNLAGSYFGLNLFTMSISSAIANILIGFILSNGRETDPIVIILCLPIVGLLCIIGYLFLQKIDFKKTK